MRDKNLMLSKHKNFVTKSTSYKNDILICKTILDLIFISTDNQVKSELTFDERMVIKKQFLLLLLYRVDSY